MPGGTLTDESPKKLEESPRKPHRRKIRIRRAASLFFFTQSTILD